MNNRTRNAIYSLVLLATILAVWWWRNRSVPQPLRIEGETMATTWHVTYFDEQQRNFKTAIDSILVEVNRSINNYDPQSLISQFNGAGSGMVVRNPFFYQPLKKAAAVYQLSNGAFDPTVMPLVNAWGFGPAKGDVPDSAAVDSLRSLVGFDKIGFSMDSVWKSDSRVQLDFGGIGQGYGADVIADLLRSKGITNMFVELGGEGVASGTNLQSGKPWRIGILDPESTREQQFFKAFVSLTDRAFTTSGNYFNFREVNGQRFSHTIDPATGYPAQRSILSASVFASDCTTADAWGTAFMVMGHEKAIEIVKSHPELDVFLVYSTPDGIATFATPGISKHLELAPKP